MKSSPFTPNNFPDFIDNGSNIHFWISVQKFGKSWTNYFGLALFLAYTIESSSSILWCAFFSFPELFKQNVSYTDL